MIQDPYKVLGVSENCSDEELKKAYREQSKRWHPDANLDHPEEAEKKFKEIQEAYRQIVDSRARGDSAYGPQRSSGAGPGSTRYGYGEYGGFGDFFNQWANGGSRQTAGEESIELTAARNYISSGHYQEAMTALNQVTEAARNARWYYYAAVTSQGLGKNVDALNYAKRASDLEPDNVTYRSLVQQMQSGGMWYQQRGESYGGFGGMSSPTGWCLSFLAMNLCCNLCLGGTGGVFWC